MRRAKSLVAIGEIELMSTTTLPALSPSAIPSLPNRAASTSGVSGTITMTMSARAATSRPELQPIAPASSSSFGRAPRLRRNSVCPAACRCVAIGRPMMPSPTKPTLLMCVFPVVLACRGSACDADRGFADCLAHAGDQVGAAGGEDADIAADGNVGKAHLEVAPRIRLHRSQNASRLAGGADARTGIGDRGLHVGMRRALVHLQIKSLKLLDCLPEIKRVSR